MLIEGWITGATSIIASRQYVSNYALGGFPSTSAICFAWIPSWRASCAADSQIPQQLAFEQLPPGLAAPFPPESTLEVPRYVSQRCRRGHLRIQHPDPGSDRYWRLTPVTIPSRSSSYRQFRRGCPDSLILDATRSHVKTGPIPMNSGAGSRPSFEE